MAADERDTASLPKLLSQWESGETFLRHYNPDGPGRFFHPVPPDRDLPAQARLGTLLAVTIELLDRNQDFRLHARVVSREKNAKQRGLRLELLEDEKDRVELLLSAARGESVPFFRRKSPRIECDLAASITDAEGNRQRGTVYSLSEGGLGIRLETPLPLDIMAEVTLPWPRRLRKLRVTGRILSIIPAGPHQGNSLEFQLETAEERARVAELVAAVRHRARR